MLGLVRIALVAWLASAAFLACGDASSTNSNGVTDKSADAGDARAHAGSGGRLAGAGGEPRGSGGATTGRGGASNDTGGIPSLGGSTGGRTTSSGGALTDANPGSGGMGIGSGGAPRRDAAANDARSTGGAAGGDSSSTVDATVTDASVSRDSSLDGFAEAGRDSPDFCRDASIPDPKTWFPPNICPVTASCNVTAPDPCTPSHCTLFGGMCVRPEPVPDGTPCDDGDPGSFAYAASNGCPSNRCLGGSNDGAACTSDSQCPGGACFMNRCVDGPNAGAACNTNTDCTGNAANATCAKGVCAGGAENGHHCKLRCVGGAFDGSRCRTASDCANPDGGNPGSCPDIPESPDCPPTGRCVRWGIDANSGACTATANNPFCNTVADCPTTQYCSGDPEHQRGINYYECYSNCCYGGLDVGPCLVWDTCDTVNHVCRRTHQNGELTTCSGNTRYVYGDAPCVGGPAGLGGTICNDVCRAGRCAHDFVTCR